jgi:hypothetical protein
MIKKTAVIIPFLLFGQFIFGQDVADAWMNAQLGQITWQESYKGVLADYHPIELVLAADQSQVAGYLIHQGDQVKHKLIGDWNAAGNFQLQERDQYDRLTGYLTGSISNDHVLMKWMSADQSRLFDVKAFPERLIKIKNFKPAAEWIEIAGTSPVYLSVQKMDYGIVSGIVNLKGRFYRFDGNCLDGTCSIWNAMIHGPEGKSIMLQMWQKDQTYYKAILDGVEYKADIKYVTPLALRQFDNSTGFLDFVYPAFVSKSYDQWLSQQVDSMWNKGISQLTSDAKSDNSQRLGYRCSGWIEIIDEGESYISGMITFINPEVVHRETFLWLKKEDTFLPQVELVNAADDIMKGSALALASTKVDQEDEYAVWLHKVGYSLLLPTVSGVAMSTQFDMLYGDEFCLLPPEESKELIKRKYWKYFGW